MDYLDQIILGDCTLVMSEMPSDSIAACITDPPYNYEFIGRKWDDKEINRRLERIQDSKTLVKNIPYGSGLAGGVRNARWYERNQENTIEYTNWCKQWVESCLECVSMALPSLYSIAPGQRRMSKLRWKTQGSIREMFWFTEGTLAFQKD